MRSRRTSIGWLASIVLSGCAPSLGAAAPQVTPWSDPDHRYSVDLPGLPTPRDVQELNGAVGAINFKVYAAESEPYSYRVAALVYPNPLPALVARSFDAREELSHASSKKVARMSGTVEHADAVADPTDTFVGEDLRFSVDAGGHHGRGLLRTFLTAKAPFVRYEALCLAPAEADLGPCERFARSLHPMAPAAAGAGAP